MKYVAVLLMLANLVELHVTYIFCIFQLNVASIIVQTEQGKVRGEYLQAVTGNFKYASFKGIPFAKPPLGDLRFTAPQPPEPWTGIRNATKHGPVCLQTPLIGGINFTGSEDCLYLNVYTPNVKPEVLLPTMFFIHGGGYQVGSGNSNRFGPDYLVTKNIVLVTSNHRLGALGFLCLNNKEVPGNAGIKDQVAALRWVHKNIAKFGGDPNKITIFGQSTGAASVGLHNLSPMSKGLYLRSVLMSASPLTDFSVPFEPTRIAFRLAQQLGCWTRDKRKLLQCLRSVSGEQLLSEKPAVLRSQDPKLPLRYLGFTPVVEHDFGQERFLTICPRDALKTGMVHEVDLLIGHTAVEGIIKFILGADSVPELYTNYPELLVPRGISEIISSKDMLCLADKIHEQYFGSKQIDNSTGKEFLQFLSDVEFNYAVTKYGRMFSEVNPCKTYMYKFSKQPDFPRYSNFLNGYGTHGAIHEDDLLYVFNPGNTTVDKTTDDYKIINEVCTMFTNFAKYGNPTPHQDSHIKWPTYNTTKGYYLDIDKEITVRQNLDAEMIKFWDSIYDAVDLEF